MFVQFFILASQWVIITDCVKSDFTLHVSSRGLARLNEIAATKMKNYIRDVPKLSAPIVHPEICGAMEAVDVALNFDPVFTHKFPKQNEIIWEAKCDSASVTARWGASYGEKNDATNGTERICEVSGFLEIEIKDLLFSLGARLNSHSSTLKLFRVTECKAEHRVLKSHVSSGTKRRNNKINALALLDVLYEMICEHMKGMFVNITETAYQTFPQTHQLDNSGHSIEYNLPRVHSIDERGVTFRYSAELEVNGRTCSLNNHFSSRGLPYRLSVTQMGALCVPVHLFNCLLHLAFENGDFNVPITNTSFGGLFRKFLKTKSSKTTCVGHLFPTFGKRYPYRLTQFLMEAVVPPRISISDYEINFTTETNLKVMLTDPNVHNEMNRIRQQPIAEMTIRTSSAVEFIVTEETVVALPVNTTVQVYEIKSDFEPCENWSDIIRHFHNLSHVSFNEIYGRALQVPIVLPVYEYWKMTNISEPILRSGSDFCVNFDFH